MSKAEQRKLNREVDIVERFVDNSRVPHRSDLFGLFDLVAMRPGEGLIGIQSCGGSDFAAHYKKIVYLRRRLSLMWLQCGGKIELWGWRKIKKRTISQQIQVGCFGDKKFDPTFKNEMIFEPRIARITMRDYKSYFIDDRGKSIICIRCGKKSYNPNDVMNLYCGYCHRFHLEFKEESKKMSNV